MRDSDTFMAIIDEGREVQIKKDILRLARKFLGEAPEPMKTRLQGITDLDRLEQIATNPKRPGRNFLHPGRFLLAAEGA